VITLRIFIAGRERLTLPYAPEHNDAVAALLHEFWPRIQGYGRLAVFLEDGNVVHFIGGAK
jgi:hypothetical protein